MSAVDETGRRPRHFGRVLLAVVALLALPVSLLISGQVRADQRAALCRQQQAEYRTLRHVIEAAVAPNPAGSSLDHLVIPPDTPASVIEILRQLTVAETHPAPAKTLLHALGPEPSC